jgi:hypothetical protein
MPPAKAPVLDAGLTPEALASRQAINCAVAIVAAMDHFNGRPVMD